ATDLVMTYGEGETEVRALDHVDAEFERGRFTAIMGPSGSGKSTLMHCMAGLDRPTSGSVRIGETEIVGLPDKELTALRRDRIGFVFQSFNLVPTLTAEENITLPQDIAGHAIDRGWFDEVIGRLGIGDRLTHRPSQLSGGQQQRVACARALVGRPDILFGDVPTGNLDSTSSAAVPPIRRSAADDFSHTAPRNSALASSSVWPAPARSRGGRTSCSGTSRPATWTPPRPRRSSRSCAARPTTSPRPS